MLRTSHTMLGEKVVIALLVGFAISGTSCVPLMAKKIAETTAASVINEIVLLVTSMDGLVQLIENYEHDKNFQDRVLMSLENINSLCTKIDDINVKMDDLNVIMKSNNDRILKTIEFKHAVNVAREFKQNFDYVNKVYHEEYSAVWSKMKDYKNGSVDDHFLHIVRDSVYKKALSDMLSVITLSPYSQSSIFSAISQYYDTQNGYQFKCENVSPLDDLHIFYANVITTIAKGYSVLLMSYQYLKNKPGLFHLYQNQQNNAYNNFYWSIGNITEQAKIEFDLIANSEYRASYACDPMEWQEGESFIRVKNYVSVQIPNIYYWKKEEASSVAESRNIDCNDGFAVYKGKPGSDDDIQSQVCFAPFSPNLGNINNEYTEFEHPRESRDWESKRCNVGDALYLLSYCGLDHSSDTYLSIRKLSVRLQECDVCKNEVVIDARFHEQDHKIHIKLCCGVLRKGEVDLKTLRWTEDNKPLLDSEYVVLSAKLKSFNLDNVVIAKGEFVTGAGFKVVNDHFISLVVKGSNYNSTNLLHGKIYSAPEPKNPRRHIDITNLTRPLNKMNQTHDMGKAGETYINLTISKWASNFTVVPYFDIASHRSSNSVAPLGGLGLFYKSLPGYAGFLAFKHLSPTYIHFVDIHT